MPKVGIHNGYWVGTGIDDMFSAMEKAASAGADVYEIETWSLLGKKKDELAALRKHASDIGIVLTCNGGFDATNDIASDDQSIRRKGVELAISMLEAMEIAGIHSWSGINYSAWLRRPEKRCFTLDEKRRIRDLSVYSLRAIAKAAQDSGVLYCLEVVNRYEQFLINTAAEGVSLAEDVGYDNVKLLLDTFHMNIEEDSITEAIRMTASHRRLGEVHTGESNRRVPGAKHSHMDWPSIFGALKEVGFDGPIVMEPFVLMGFPLAYDICVWRPMAQEESLDFLFRDISRGVEFIRSFFQ